MYSSCINKNTLQEVTSSTSKMSQTKGIPKGKGQERVPGTLSIIAKLFYYFVIMPQTFCTKWKGFLPSSQFTAGTGISKNLCNG